MPAHVQHGQWSTATLGIIGSDDSEYSQQIQATIRNTVALRMTCGCRRRQTLGSNWAKDARNGGLVVCEMVEKTRRSGVYRHPKTS